MITPVNNLVNNPPPISNHPIFDRIHDIKKDFVKIETLNAKKVLDKEKQANLMLDISFYAVLGVACLGVIFVYKKVKGLLHKLFSPIIDITKRTYKKIEKISSDIKQKILLKCKPEKP